MGDVGREGRAMTLNDIITDEFFQMVTAIAMVRRLEQVGLLPHDGSPVALRRRAMDLVMARNMVGRSDGLLIAQMLIGGEIPNVPWSIAAGNVAHVAVFLDKFDALVTAGATAALDRMAHDLVHGTAPQGVEPVGIMRTSSEQLRGLA